MTLLLLQPPVPRMTGRDAVEFFTRAYHTGKIKYMYFNIVHSRCYRPYDLIAVPKYKVSYYYECTTIFIG